MGTFRFRFQVRTLPVGVQLEIHMKQFKGTVPLMVSLKHEALRAPLAAVDGEDGSVLRHVTGPIHAGEHVRNAAAQVPGDRRADPNQCHQGVANRTGCPGCHRDLGLDGLQDLQALQGIR